jgi:hypothetical protein
VRLHKSNYDYFVRDIQVIDWLIDWLSV